MAAALEGISPEIAILDEAGFIVYVNSAWTKFAIENASLDPEAYLGQNYVDACLKAVPPATCSGGRPQKGSRL